MESSSLLEEIQSKYISKNIFDYVKDSNYLLKLVKYSKRLQDAFQLKIEDYKKKSYEIVNYSKFENYLYVKRSSKFKKNYLKNKFEMDLTQHDKDIKNTISNEFSEIYFTNKYKYYQSNEQIKKNILDKQFYIDIQSPFYESLSKNPIFPNFFIIRISLPLIKENNLMNDYIKEFEQLNTNNNYSSLCFQFDSLTKEYNDIQQYNIDFGKIKKLIFEEKATKYFNYSDTGNTGNEFLLFTTIISNDDVVKNLMFLEIKYLRTEKKFLFGLENINNFKSLEELRLENVLFSDNLILKLNTLKYLALCNCNQIGISENCASNIKTLSLFRSELMQINTSLLQFPELEQLKISFCYYNCCISDFSPIAFYRNFKRTIDLKSLKKLKFLFRGDISVLLALENNPLEKAYISSYSLDDYENYNFNNVKQIEKNMIKKFIEIKTLKEIKLRLYCIDSNDLESIEGENTSVEKLIIDFHKSKNDDNDTLLYNLLKKFPNLKEIEIYDYSPIKKINLEQNHKIERLKYLRVVKYWERICNSQLDIYSFEHLKDLELRNITKINFPLFDDNCKYNFKSLIRFHLDNSNNMSDQIYLKMIKNVIKNIKKIPSLKSFIFKCYSNINEREYNNLVKGISKLKIKSIVFAINRFNGANSNKIICNKEYTQNDLQLLYENKEFKCLDNNKKCKFNA